MAKVYTYTAFDAAVFDTSYEAIDCCFHVGSVQKATLKCFLKIRVGGVPAPRRVRG